MKAKVLSKTLNLRDAEGKYHTNAQGTIVDVIRDKEAENLLRKGFIEPAPEKVK